MKINSLTPVMWVENIQKTVNYYEHTLGFKPVNYEEGSGWAVVMRDNVEIMFALPNDHISFGGSGFTGSFYLNTDDVDQWWQLLKGTAEIFYEIENFEYGMREFAIKDCNGFILQFGQPVNE
ncbi:MAG TPA: VOC family protein [Puia sp.]|jgi:uncharacterized glyoxalase superfamily protein PhnB|nr:VOC family protein [Puia sp.]